MPSSYRICSAASRMEFSTSLRLLATTSSMRPGWMRPSATSFSSASRAVSRRMGSKPKRTTASGVSSMITSIPVACSKARMFRPSRPMMRPFISSDGRETTETVVSAVWSAAMRWMAREMIFLASLGIAARLLLAPAHPLRALVVGGLLHVVQELPRRLVGAEPGERFQPVLHLGEALPQLFVARLHLLLAAGQLVAALLHLVLLLVDQVELAVQRLLALLEAALHALDVLAAAAFLALPLLAGADGLLAPLQDLGLAQALGLFLGARADARGLVFGRGARLLQARLDRRAARGKAGDRGHHGHDDGDQDRVHCRIYVGAEPGSPRREPKQSGGRPTTPPPRRVRAVR